jgi:glutamyl-tRNA reductase
MKIENLKVLHVGTSGSTFCEGSGDNDAWVIKTCQRTVVVTTADKTFDTSTLETPPTTFTGREAYAFLLRFACGLESKMLGETEVFGQIKQEWKVFAERQSEFSKDLHKLVQTWFKHTKQIRSYHLVNMGSSSYGSQVRKLLGVTKGTTLIVGAGQLAQSIAPWLETEELVIWNRTIEKAKDLQELVVLRHSEQQCRVHAGGELQAWHQTDNVIVCIPADPRMDSERVWTWMQKPSRGVIIHLGLDDIEGTEWSQVANLFSLTTLFEMMRRTAEEKQVCLAKAFEACTEKSTQFLCSHN